VIERLVGFKQQRQSPEKFLLVVTFGLTLGFSTWQTLLNNFVVEKAAFTGEEIGILQSLREVPGFLAFTAVLVLWLLREQSFLLISLALTGVGVALTGQFPSAVGLYCTTILMSIGFHYFETLQQSLALQWYPKHSAAQGMGRLIASRSAAAMTVYALISLATMVFSVAYEIVYLVGGVCTVIIAVYAALIFPQFKEHTEQRKTLVLRKNYWLYYALTLMSGARRQIFIVFTSFLMVEKFGFTVSNIALLYLLNHSINMFLAPKVGAWISKVGERKALIIEYGGLVVIFTAYAFVDNAALAAGLFVADHVLYAMSIAIKTYFQKIADPKDISASAAVSFSINHLAAVAIPAAFGLIWLDSPATVFLLGAAMAVISLVLATNVPERPGPASIARWWGNCPEAQSSGVKNAV
jgi:predicted MFS family arabinose efflux permease